MKRLSRLFGATLIASLLTFSTSSYALFGVGDIVLDPTNLVQNTSTAISAVKTEVSTASSYIQQIKSTMELVKSTMSLDGLSKLAGLQDELNLYRDLKNTGEQLSSSIQVSQQLSRDMQANFGASNMSWKTFLESGARSDISRAQVMMDQFSTINKSIEKVSTRRQDIVEKLQSAQGPTQATQAVGAAIDTVIGQNQQIVSALGTQIANAAGDKMVQTDKKQAADAYYEAYQQKLRDASTKYVIPGK